MTVRVLHGARVVLARAQQQADRQVLVGFADVAVEGLEIQAQLAQVLRFEPADLQLDGDQGVEAPVEEQQVEREVPAADLKRILRPHETEVAAQFDHEIPELAEQAEVQVGLAVFRRKVQEFDHIGVAVASQGFMAARRERSSARVMNATIPQH